MLGIVTLVSALLGLSAFAFSFDPTDDDDDNDERSDSVDTNGFAEDESIKDEPTSNLLDSVDFDLVPSPDIILNDEIAAPVQSADIDPEKFDTIDLTFTKALHPLDDFTMDDDFVSVLAGGDDIVQFSLPESDGNSLYILPADYQETYSSDTAEIQTTYYGYNVYLIPEGEDFPEDYLWSEEGATLYNLEGQRNMETDFGGIRLVSRIDCGFTTTVSSLDGEHNEDFENYLGIPQIMVNGAIEWA